MNSVIDQFEVFKISVPLISLQYYSSTKLIQQTQTESVHLPACRPLHCRGNAEEIGKTTSLGRFKARQVHSLSPRNARYFPPLPKLSQGTSPLRSLSSLTSIPLPTPAQLIRPQVNDCLLNF